VEDRNRKLSGGLLELQGLEKKMMIPPPLRKMSVFLEREG
jgi:hypothetical protein